jgi:hypothetical protein
LRGDLFANSQSEQAPRDPEIKQPAVIEFGNPKLSEGLRQANVGNERFGSHELFPSESAVSLMNWLVALADPSDGVIS